MNPEASNPFGLPPEIAASLKPMSMSQSLEKEEQGGEYSRSFREKLLAAAVQRLVKKGLQDAAAVLLECEIDLDTIWPDESPRSFMDVLLTVNSDGFDALNAKPTHSALESVFEELLGPYQALGRVLLAIRLDDVEEGWREAAYAALGKSEGNQGNLVSQGSKMYNGLRYRSFSEIALAQELDNRGVLFFPLPAASRKRVIREPDFLIVHEGRVGILEIHGEPFHPPSRAAQDHARNRFFELSGIRVQVYDAKVLRENTKTIVDQFLKLLLGPPR